MNNLFCCETTATENRAYPDPTLLNDKRVLHNLLRTEERYTVTSHFKHVQIEVTAEMRKIVAEWMMEVCEDQKCQDEVFNLSVNYMDRFLQVCCIKKNQLQLLGTTCMLIASKLKEPKPLAAETLVFYTDNSITINDLWQWELLVLSKLKWDMAAITPQDFLCHILTRIPVAELGIKNDLVNSHAKTLIALCAREYVFSNYPASMIASACVASALRGLGWRKSGHSTNDLLNILHAITAIEQDCLRTCLKEIDAMVETNSPSEIEENVQRPNEFTPPPMTSDKFLEHESAGTPTDVRDVHF